MNKYLIIYTLCLCLSASLKAHGDKTPIVLKGVVTDHQSGDVIKGAVISIEKNGEVIHSIESDQQGNFLLRYEGSFIRTDNLKVSIYKNGYRLQKIKPLNCEKEEVKIELERRSRFAPLVLPTGSKPAYNI